MSESRLLRRRAFGLTTRLVLGYMLVAFLALTAASLFLHKRLRDGFEVEDAELISDHIDILRGEVLANPDNFHEAGEVIGTTSPNRTLEKYYGRLTDHKGEMLLETPGYEEIAPESGAFPPPLTVTDRVGHITRARSSAGIALFVASAQIARSPHRPPLIYHVVMDITHMEEWLAEFRMQLIIVVVGGTAVSGVLALFLTRSGLRPLREITATMQSVGASGLEQRLGSNRWPRELAALAGEFDLMLERLEEAFQRLTRFSADAAHEFRTPLNNLMVATSFMLSREHDGEEYRHALAANLEEYERLKQLMDRLLFLARADNAEAVLKLTNVEASSLASGVLDFFSALAEERGVVLTCECHGHVFADETLLRMALANLVSNALRHTPQGGEVRLMIKEDHDVCRISVADTGTGIAAHHLPRLFDRFYRIDTSRTHVAGDTGSGLGLALVQTVARLHGGSVNVTSKVGSGTTMHLNFPARGAS